MNILFLHRNFPAQFRNLAPALASNPENKVAFITNNENRSAKNIIKVQYKLKREVPADCHRYLRFFEESVIHGQSCAEAAYALKEKGFIPDVIFGHTWGNTLYMKDVFPEAKLLCYFEWFYNAKGGDIGFAGDEQSIDDLAKLRTKNAHLLIDLYSCDRGFCPTKFQRKQFPKEFWDKIDVMHDGIDTEYCVPNENATFTVKDKNLTFTKNDEIVTYATRGMEAYRGFPEFMRAAEILLKKRPNLHIIIAGEDRVCYGSKLANTTYKKMMLEQLDLDMNRLHFVGGLPYNEFVHLMQITSAHVYLTYPFVCSWSLLEAMSCETPIIASDTEPVTEFVEDGVNGLLFNFFDINEQVKQIEYALDNRKAMLPLRKKARKLIVENYALKDLLPIHIENIMKLAGKTTAGV
ncbi:glycosyltransferase [bacterium]|nr:glycosyltransferase [bacterium]